MSKPKTCSICGKRFKEGDTIVSTVKGKAHKKCVKKKKGPKVKRALKNLLSDMLENKEKYDIGRNTPEGEPVRNAKEINRNYCHQFAMAADRKIKGAKMICNLEFAAQTVGGMGGEHCWVKIGNKHYSAEKVNGVKNWRNLPFWKLLIKDGEWTKKQLKHTKIVKGEVVFDFMDKTWGQADVDKVREKARNKYPSFRGVFEEAEKETEEYFERLRS